jgi:hypothetical protein
MAAKVSSKILMIKKHVIFVPMLLLLPWFMEHPCLPRVLAMLLLAPYYFICFMGPVYIFRYFIGVMNISQKAVDAIFGLGLAFECSFMAREFVLAFMARGIDGSDMFLIPARVFAATMAAMLALASALRAFNYGYEPDDD